MQATSRNLTMMMANFRSDNRAAETIKELLTAEQVVRHYGFQPSRSGFIQCPFHKGDRHGSLKVYPGNRGWHCFGCQRGGSVIDFVMELFGISFSQAIVRLNSDFGLGLTNERPSHAQRLEALRKRQEAEEQAAKERAEYFALAEEHRYWFEVQKYFAPTREEWEAGYIHPLYEEAIRRLPALESYLDELDEHLRR